MFVLVMLVIFFNSEIITYKKFYGCLKEPLSFFSPGCWSGVCYYNFLPLLVLISCFMSWKLEIYKVPNLFIMKFETLEFDVMQLVNIWELTCMVLFFVNMDVIALYVV